MYNKQLADKIVAYLKSAFPDKVQLGDLQNALPEFSDVPEEEWLRVFEVLEHEGRVEFKGLRTGYDNKLQMVANVRCLLERHASTQGRRCRTFQRFLQLRFSTRRR